MFAAIRAGLRPDIGCLEVEANINDPAFVEAAVAAFLELWQQRRPLPSGAGGRDRA